MFMRSKAESMRASKQVINELKGKINVYIRYTRVRMLVNK